MGFLTPILIAVLFLIFLYFLMRLTVAFNNRRCRKHIMKKKAYTEDSFEALMEASYGSHYLIKKRFIQVKRGSSLSYRQIPHLLLTNQGIVLITICEAYGEIDNQGDIWHIYYTDDDDSEKILSLENPIAAGDDILHSLQHIFEKTALPFAFPMEQIVIFTSRKIRFLHPRQEELLSPPEATKLLDTYHKKSVLTKEQKDKIKETVFRYSKKKYKKAAKTAPSRQRKK